MKRNYQNRGFTIVELLTVMAVIAMLIGLLVPALSLVMRHAKDTRQKAQFHSISVALEMFKNAEGDYPDSSEINQGSYITGAQRFAEALVGRDLQGFDPVSNWHPALDTANVTNAYSTNTGGSPSLKQQSLDRRKGPYLKLENVGAFDIWQLYLPSRVTTIEGGTNPGGTPPPLLAPVITDVYTDRSVTLQMTIAGVTTSKTVKAGTPILYYRANPANKDLQLNTNGNNLTIRTYNYNDNREILALGRMMSPPPSPPASPAQAWDLDAGTNYQSFYRTIQNPQITTNNEGVAYNQDSFILMSAGKDGLFGTADDVYNFGE